MVFIAWRISDCRAGIGLRRARIKRETWGGGRIVSKEMKMVLVLEVYVNLSLSMLLEMLNSCTFAC